MGFFNTTPKNKQESKVYEQEKATALNAYNKTKSGERMDALKAQARMDALPRHERAKVRAMKGFNAIKYGTQKLVALDKKLDERARAQGYKGSIIEQAHAQDVKRSSHENSFIVSSLHKDKDRAHEGGFIQQSMNGAQGEGLIVQSLRQNTKRR